MVSGQWSENGGTQACPNPSPHQQAGAGSSCGLECGEHYRVLQARSLSYVTVLTYCACITRVTCLLAYLPTYYTATRYRPTTMAARESSGPRPRCVGGLHLQ